MASTHPTPRAPTRVYIDGCFDLFHIGHANAIRQAHEHGDVVVVGSHTDAEIAKSKGTPVLNERERYKLIRACRWVDEFIADAPYTPTVELMREHKLDFVLHGEDITLDEFGNDVYGDLKEGGFYKEIRRARGISTTDIIDRMIASASAARPSAADEGDGAAAEVSPYTGSSAFVALASKLALFTPPPPRAPPRTVCYVEGTWDLFNTAHVDLLETLRGRFDRVVCGVFSDAVVAQLHGAGRPILGAFERAMSCLQCRFCDDVVLDPPELSHAFAEELGITHFVAPSGDCRAAESFGAFRDEVRFRVPRKLGRFEEVAAPSLGRATDSVIARVVAAAAEFAERNARKNAKELRRIAANCRGDRSPP